MPVEHQHDMPVALERRLRIAKLKRQMGRTAAKVNAVLERPARVGQGDSHARTRPRRSETRGGTNAASIQRARSRTPSRQPMVACQETASVSCRVSATK